MSEIIHIAGPVVIFRSIQRQRCSWCGALIQEHDLARISRPLEPDEDPDNPEPWEPGHWEVGGLVAMEGTFPAASWVVEPEVEDGEAQAPELSCMLRLPEDPTSS
jgi:hypothetical protein